jgi:TetR/AcrR family transcriptional regulator, transcriptional repressor for nem operon
MARATYSLFIGNYSLITEMARPRAFDENLVLDRALNLFWHRGYEATSMQQLVNALGINRASLYDTFGDKYSLYIKALIQYRDQNQAAIAGLFSQPRPAPDLIRELLDRAVTESVTDSLCKGCFFVNAGVELAPHDPDIAALVRQNQQFLETTLEMVVARGQAEGNITPTQTPAALARLVYNTLTGLKTSGKLNPDEAALRSVVNVTMAMMAG